MEFLKIVYVFSRC